MQLPDIWVEIPPPSNLRIIRHIQNRRQGAARNTGVKAAEGEYILFLDCDDELTPGSLNRIWNEVKNDDIDILFFAYESSLNGVIETNQSYVSNSGIKMSGREFFSSQSIPWTPWQYLYRRSLIVDNDLWQVEGHMFEDADFVLKTTLAAKSMRYVNDVNLRYHLSENQTTKIRSGDSWKVRDMFYLNQRVLHIARNENDKQIKDLIYGQYFYRQKKLIMRYLWHMNHSTMIRLLTEFRTAEHPPGMLLRFSRHCPRLLALMLTAAKPLLPIVRKIVIAQRNHK